jgi:hypothetical protein
MGVPSRELAQSGQTEVLLSAYGTIICDLDRRMDDKIEPRRSLRTCHVSPSGRNRN